MNAVPPGRHLIADLYLAIDGAGSALTGPDAVHATLTASRGSPPSPASKPPRL